MKRLLMFVVLLGFASAGHAQKASYLEEIKKAVEKGWAENPSVIAAWKAGVKSNILWGYNAPAHPVYLASTLAFLYEQTGEKQYAERAASLLTSFGDLRSILPPDYAKSRAEYREGVPSLSNFFFLPPYSRAYMRIRNSGVMDAAARAKIEREIAESITFVFRFPEWGGHNRAMLRAEALQYAVMAMPDHKDAPRWRQMAAVIASDNLHRWEVEDATGYHPVWLHALLSYCEAANRPDGVSNLMFRYYLEYFTRMIAPDGNLPDYGDTHWSGAASGLRFTAIFEKGAALTKDPAVKWAARSMMEVVKRQSPVLGVGDAYHLSDAFRWADESIPAERPAGLSQEVLEDVIGKKIVFRNGWDTLSTYMLLNYRDEGDGGWQDREYLRRTISVEEEKMHHGHADENSIVLLMDRGSVLLHDGGYRDALPSGRFGAWRQDYFHNRIVARKDKRDTSQNVMEFLRNSGAYRPVRTQKVEFQNLAAVDMSRTRLVDENLGYAWDRTVVYVEDPGYFVVIDGIRVLRPDYFTFTNLWHAQRIVRKGPHFYSVVNDSIRTFPFRTNRALLIAFPETYGKTDGVEPISRQHQQEQAIYQTQSSQYKTNDLECFVTLLIPHDRDAEAEKILRGFRMLPTSAPYRAVGMEIPGKGGTSMLMVKMDLEMEVARENIRPRYQYDLGKVTCGPFETDAWFLFATEKGKTVSYSATNFLAVKYGGKALVEALPNTHPLQLDGSDIRVGYSKWRRWEETVTMPGK